MLSPCHKYDSTRPQDLATASSEKPDLHGDGPQMPITSVSLHGGNEGGREGTEWDKAERVPNEAGSGRDRMTIRGMWGGQIGPRNGT